MISSQYLEHEHSSELKESSDRDIGWYMTTNEDVKCFLIENNRAKY
jgi:hypothetical protein